ncbi:protein-export membrane protein, SecD/SecF family [Thermanaerovibrio velox DSM 12556]|uniref:Protein-export membrane protein SecF n=1 Tax=Thermanaerovibrio velox DSM 12556 TaxID=926567 RepID=H0UQF4_9BACT|nr:protein translocase subunit SecF [Thermanaerovibrio velox]EHM09708.1 protein-export membrane protein, SecD/SecF family [Thermanaerovibrio velox DSM 12556]
MTIKTHDLKIPFMNFRRIALGISLAAVLISLFLVVTKGLNLGVDYTGGVLMQVETPKPAEVGEIRAAVSSKVSGEPVIQAFGPRDFLIRLKSVSDSERRAALDVMRDRFGEVKVLKLETVGPVVGSELKGQAIIALTLALGGILLYMAFRFKFRFGVAAVLSLVHDAAIMLGVYSLTGREVSVSFIAAVLTVVGYSLNDSIVVLDRVRENWRDVPRKGVLQVIDDSINQTLSRTINTSLTTLLPVLAMFFLGGDVISNFAFAFLVGIGVGTYSSIYIAGAILAEWYLKSPLKD